MTAINEEVRMVVIALLTGVSVQEQRWDEIDLDAGAIQLGGEAARAIPLHKSRCAALYSKNRISERMEAKPSFTIAVAAALQSRKLDR